MGAPNPFLPYGKTFLFSTTVAINTTQSRQILTTDIFGAGNAALTPNAVRIHNSGTVVVWFNFTAAAGAVVVPTAGLTTVGAPQLAIPIYPGLVEVFTLQLPWTPLGIPGVPGVFMQDISGTASQPYELTFGEGL